MNTMITHLKTCFKKSFVMEGRASRSEYWYFVLSYILIALFLIGGGFIIAETINEASGIILLTAGIIFIIIAIPAAISVRVRRLHDIGYNGWWIFISFVPFIGGAWSLVLSVLESEPFPNKYGDNPYGKGGNANSFCSQCGAKKKNKDAKFCHACGIQYEEQENNEGIKGKEGEKEEEKWA